MQIIEIEKLDNGAHRNQSGDNLIIPDGWALVPESLKTDNFPFGEVTTEIIENIVTVTGWVPLPFPEPVVVEPEPTAEELIDAMLGVGTV